MADDCIFCRIVKGEIPSAKVYEDDNVYAFLDIAPVNKGHTLVVPKKHSRDLFEMDDRDACKVMEAIKKIAPAVKEGVKADGIIVSQSNGKAAGQVIMHAHFHIIPRFENDGLKLFPQGKYEEGQIEEVAEEIKQNL